MAPDSASGGCCSWQCSVASLTALECSDACLANTFVWFDKCIRVVEPVLAVLATVLVLVDAGVYFQDVLPRVLEERGTHAAVLHLCLAVWLLFNVLWNQAFCTFTRPGSTLEADPYELQEAMTYDWRWCNKCKRGKPPLSHHCSVCQKCVLKMDHHCPWMANCIGFFNYRYFVLYLFYMWIGALYSMLMSLWHIPNLFDLAHSHRRDFPIWPFAMFVMAAAVFIAMTVLFGMHAWMVLSGQGTISMVALYSQDLDRQARRGALHGNPYHLGPVRNWQEAFDVSGALWWLRWMLPSSKRKAGYGWALPQRGDCLSHLNPHPHSQQSPHPQQQLGQWSNGNGVQHSQHPQHQQLQHRPQDGMA